jgi:hypothetical protein
LDLELKTDIHFEDLLEEAFERSKHLKSSGTQHSSHMSDSSQRSSPRQHLQAVHHHHQQHIVNSSRDSHDEKHQHKSKDTKSQDRHEADQKRLGREERKSSSEFEGSSKGRHSYSSGFDQLHSRSRSSTSTTSSSLYSHSRSFFLSTIPITHYNFNL